MCINASPYVTTGLGTHARTLTVPGAARDTLTPSAPGSKPVAVRPLPKPSFDLTFLCVHEHRHQDPLWFPALHRSLCSRDACFSSPQRLPSSRLPKGSRWSPNPQDNCVSRRGHSSRTHSSSNAAAAETDLVQIPSCSPSLLGLEGG